MTEVSKMQPVVPYLYPFGASVRVKHVQVLNPNDFSCLPDCCTSAVPKRIFFFNGSFILVVHFVCSLSFKFYIFDCFKKFLEGPVHLVPVAVVGVGASAGNAVDALGMATHPEIVVSVHVGGRVLVLHIQM